MDIGSFGGFPDIDSYIKDKADRILADEKNIKTLFRYMFSEEQNIMAESPDGLLIKKITYGECKDKIRRIAPALKLELADLPQDSIVGLYMSNSIEWIQMLWALLMCGYRPLLMNSRLADATLEKIIKDHGVGAVVSDGKAFSVKTVDAFEVIKKIGEAMSEEDESFANEIIFMSSGTTNNVKLCFYNGENLCYQVSDSRNIVEICPLMRDGYEGNLKLLTLLPFYHIFGFVAVYIWFGFFSRTFVFLKDMNPNTIQNTIKRHKVTHIFAVPLVWDKVYRAAMKKISSRGKVTLAKFNHALSLSTHSGKLGEAVAAKAFKEVRDGLFGESVKFMISGGSSISREVLTFFNGIGYHLANGYGMTEIGISSVELSMSRAALNSGSIGAPFGMTEYKIDDKTGELLVKSKTMAYKIIQGDSETLTNFDEFFNTHDLATCKGGRYYLDGRRDDLIVCENGENLNPIIAEQNLKIPGCENLCVFQDKDGQPTLLLSVQNCYTPEQFDAVRRHAAKALSTARLDGEIKKIAITIDPLIAGSDFKLNRKKIARAFAAGEYSIYDAENKDIAKKAVSQIEIKMRDCFAEVLGKSPDEIGPNDDFFVDLGGTSLDYFMLMDAVKNEFDVDFPIKDDFSLSTLHDLCEYIKNNDLDNGGKKW